MTYKESEFPQLLEVINEYRKKGIPLEEIVKQAFELYKRVPIYIGIVSMCLENFVSESLPDKLKNGDVVVVMDKNCIYQGKVQSVKNNKVKLKNLKIVYKKNIKELSLKNKKVFKFNYNVLEKLWPSLSFKKKEK